MLYLGAQPGTSSMNGGQWDAAVEGTQNFSDFSDHGDIAQDSEEYPYNLDDLEDYHQPKWTALGSVAGPAPMRRTVSRSSAGSFKSRTIRPSSHKARPRIQTALSQGVTSAFASTPSNSTAGYDMTGSGFVTGGALSSAMSAGSSMHTYYQDGSGVSGGHMNPQYLSMYSQGLGSTAYNTDGISYSSELSASLGHVQQHVDPSCTQMNMDFEPSPAAVSPQTWGSSSSRRSSPDLGGEDTWSLPVAPSPAESHDSTVSSFAAQLDADGSLQGAMGDDFSLSATFQQKRSNSEGESARDHPLYKSAACQPDGFYHCPWEGKDSCNHKPEKLKCNYDKFVDSHLKPYRCKHNSCENARFSSTACLLRHEREAHAMHGHGDKPYLCPYPECDRAQSGFGFPRQWNLKDHMRRVHRDDGSQLAQMAATAVTSVDTSPVATSSSQAVSKGRKRKKDALPNGAGSSSASSSRKSSTSKASSRGQQASARESSGSDNNNNNDANESANRQAERQALAVAAANAAANKAAIELEQTVNEWYVHKKALSGIVMGFTQPNDPEMLQQLQSAQMHVDAIGRISADMISSIQAPYIRSFPQQSG